MTPQLAKFSNETARPLADLCIRTYYKAKDAMSVLVSVPDLTSALHSTLVIDDGAATDGRIEITGNDVLDSITAIGRFVAAMEADNNAVLNTIRKIAVNP